MKRKVLALLLAVMMIVPATSMIASANNMAYGSMTMVTGTAGVATVKEGRYALSSVNAGGTFDDGTQIAEFEPNTVWYNDDASVNINMPGRTDVVLGDTTYRLVAATGDDETYSHYQTVAPRCQFTTTFKNALDGSGVDFGTLAFADPPSNGYLMSGCSPTTISYAWSTDPIPEVSSAETSDNRGYIVYDPEDEPVVGDESGLIRNGVVLSISSGGVYGNGYIFSSDKLAFRTTTVANQYSIALYENGEIIAVENGTLEVPMPKGTYDYGGQNVPVPNLPATADPDAPAQTLYNNDMIVMYLLSEEYGGYIDSGALFCNAAFDGSSLSFTLGDGFGNGHHTFTVTTESGEGWENLTRLSPYQDFYFGLMCGSPQEVTEFSGEHGTNPWGGSSFLVHRVNGDLVAAAKGSGATREDGAASDIETVRANTNAETIGLADLEGSANSEKKGVRMYFNVNTDYALGTPIYSVELPREEYLGGIVYEEGGTQTLEVKEVGFFAAKHKVAAATSGLRKRITMDPVTREITKDATATVAANTGNVVVTKVFENGQQVGLAHDEKNGSVIFGGSIIGIPDAKFDDSYYLKVYAILSINGEPSKIVTTQNNAWHNTFNRAISDLPFENGANYRIK